MAISAIQSCAGDAASPPGSPDDAPPSLTPQQPSPAALKLRAMAEQATTIEAARDDAVDEVLKAAASMQADLEAAQANRAILLAAIHATSQHLRLTRVAQTAVLAAKDAASVLGDRLVTAESALRGEESRMGAPKLLSAEVDAAQAAATAAVAATDAAAKLRAKVVAAEREAATMRAAAEAAMAARAEQRRKAGAADRAAAAAVAAADAAVAAADAMEARLTASEAGGGAGVEGGGWESQLECLLAEVRHEERREAAGAAEAVEAVARQQSAARTKAALQAGFEAVQQRAAERAAASPVDAPAPPPPEACDDHGDFAADAAQAKRASFAGVPLHIAQFPAVPPRPSKPHGPFTPVVSLLPVV